MRFTAFLRSPKNIELYFVPLLDVLLLGLVFFSASPFFFGSNGTAVLLPTVVTSGEIRDENISIVVTAENIVYLDNKVVTLEELRIALLRLRKNTQSVFIKADRRSSIGRVVDIWEMARSLGMQKVNVATDQER